MKRRIVAFLAVVTMFSSCLSFARAPKGKLVYCSYASCGAAALGTDYCEMIADEEGGPKIKVVLDRDCHFAPERRGEFAVSEAEVAQLQELLDSAKVYKLDGYSVNEPICGGRSYRIHLEYDSGEKITASWYGHNIKEKALRDYALIQNWFAPWRRQVPPREEIRQ